MWRLVTAMFILCSVALASPAVAEDGATRDAATQTTTTTAATPTTIRVVNKAAGPVTLDRSFGPAQPFSIVALDGDLGAHVSLDEQDDAKTGGWIEMCECACGPTPCPECEAPAVVEVVLAPGEAYELPWSGQLRREVQHPMGGICFETFTPPAGRYEISACTTRKKCGKAKVSLPSEEGIEIALRGAP